MNQMRTKPRLRKSLILAVALMAIGLGSWQVRLKMMDRQTHEEHEDTEQMVRRGEEDLGKYGVGFADAASGKLSIELKVPGEVKLNGDAVAHMVPRFPGVVRQIAKNLGDTVKKGDVLAVFENNANLSTFDMRAQMDGVVIEKNIALGEVIGSGEEAFVIADLNQVWVDLYIYPTDLARVKSGQRVRILDASSGREAHGTLAYVAPTVSTHTRTALARVILDNPEHLWRPGSFITGAIIIDESDASVLVDAASVQEINGVQMVFVKHASPEAAEKDHEHEDKHEHEKEGFVATPVKIGRRDDKQVEILSGVVPGARIATTGSFLLKAELAKGQMEAHEH